MWLGNMRHSDRGDTIIEVLFAVAIFSMIAVGSLSIMNQSISMAQRSLEITLVRQQMDAQAETLRYINQAYIASYQRGGTPPAPGTTAGEWPIIIGKKVDVASLFGNSGGVICSNIPQGGFILNTQTAKVWNQAPKSTAEAGSPPFSQVRYNGAAISDAFGIWIEAVQSQAVGQLGYVDFHIRTCWNSPGSNTVSTLGTIVRLYEPR